MWTALLRSIQKRFEMPQACLQTQYFRQSIRYMLLGTNIHQLIFPLLSSLPENTMPSANVLRPSRTRAV